MSAAGKKEERSVSRDYDEKRNFIRMCMECPMTFTRYGGSVHTATARDLSGSGLGFVTDQALTLGEVLSVKVVPGQAVVAPLQAEVEVVRVQPHDVDRYEIGVTIRRFL
jgi:hypothetical protein